MIRLRVPKLRDEGVVFRVAGDAGEVSAANRLVLESYLAAGLWVDDREIERNYYLHSSERTCFVAYQGTRLLATASIVQDSPNGLPSDKFKPALMRKIRTGSPRLAEVTALAVEPRSSASRELVLFLYAFLYQYSFFYAGLDRFVVSSTEKHARFYESVFGFERLSTAEQHYYVRVKGELLTVDLLRSRLASAETYGIERELEECGSDTFYHFLYTKPHPSFCFPEKRWLRRSRQRDWLVAARRGKSSARWAWSRSKAALETAAHIY